MRWFQTFIAFKYPNYRLWFFGQMVSLFGSWMQATAQSYLVFELTRSPAYLGYVSFSTGLPTCLLLLYGGVIADRLPKRTLLIMTQAVMMLLAVVLAVITFRGWVQPWHIILLAFGLGVANAFDAPARHAFVFELVGPEALTNAIGLNSSLFNAGLAVGPAIAGITYMLFGPAWCFTINAITFLPVIVALILMKIKPLDRPAGRPSALSSLKEGIHYVAFTPAIRALICTVACICLFGYAFTTLIPAWAVTILGGDAATNGLLQSARGSGALLSALLIASLGNFKSKGKFLAIDLFVFPVVLLIFACMRTLPLSLAVLVLVGLTMTFVLNIANILLQESVPDDLRGRVMSIYSLTMFGLIPLGGLMAGLLAEHAGEPATVVITSVCSLACALMLWLYAPHLRIRK